MRTFGVFSFLMVLLSACIRQDFEEQRAISSSFEFATTQHEDIRLGFYDALGNPITGVPVKVREHSQGGPGQIWFEGLTDGHGELKGMVNLPTYLTEVVVEFAYIGLPKHHLLSVESGQISYDFRVSKRDSHTISYEDSPDLQGKLAVQRRSEAATVNYMGSYDTQGVPTYLDPFRDVISADLLSFINSSLPESKPVPTYHPRYLDDDSKINLEVAAPADVWLTFVHEGAGWRNALGYYTYPTGSPPTTEDEISSLNIAFPNASFAGAGGGLTSGDKVYLGTFDAGTTIGFVIFANGWNSTSQNVSNEYYRIFSDRELNPESDANLRQHNVLLYDEINELFLLGFEDINRESPSCDQDFNDAVFYLTANPIENINTEGIRPIDQPGDNDGDGVSNVYDDFPDDANYAYRNFYPSENTYGTLAFEDLWPATGDYDFNDLVVDYRYEYLLNPVNEIVSIEAEFVTQAIGAGYHNGFGFAMDATPGMVGNVTGSALSTDVFSIGANGTENGQSNAVIIAFDDAYVLFNRGGGFVNTQAADSYTTPDTLNMTISLNGSFSYAELGAAPYNPFLVVDGIRGKEVHLPSYEPTDLIDPSWFGNDQDGSNPSLGIYYKATGDLPWAMNLPARLDWPLESEDIRSAHVHFKTWVDSDGFSLMDWYLDNPGYRNHALIYQKPE